MNKCYFIIVIVFVIGMILYGQSNDSYNGEDLLITQSTVCNADFSYKVIRKTSETVLIKFMNTMPGVSARFFWDFGDGSKSRDQNPAHTFTLSVKKDFMVTLQVSFGACSDKKTQTLSFSENECSAEFTYEILKSDQTSAEVKFVVNEPIPSAQYKWSFGDRKATRRQDPVHTYNFKGNVEYKVTLTVVAGSCNDETARIIQLGKSEPEDPEDICSSDFKYEIISQDIHSTTIEFTSSMEDADAYAWDFGDKNKSKDKNPVHTYKLNNIYEVTVSLEVQKGKCLDKHTETIIIPEVEEDVTCSAAFTYEIISVISGQAIVNFQSEMEDASLYKWSFGDGKLSGDKNPVHVFSTSVQNTYQIRLEVEKGKCRDLKQETITLEKEEVVDDVCSADFTFEIKQSKGTGGVIQCSSTMTDASSYVWDFGDGIKAGELNPSHTYDISKSRNFTITLEVHKGNCTDKKSKQVIFPGESEDECTANFSFEIVRQDKIKALVQFVTATTDSSAQYFWNFGDNTSSTKQNPVHTYKITEKQQYQVILNVVKDNCSDTQLVPLNFSEGLCTAEFTVQITYNDGERARVEIQCKENKPYADFTCNFGDGSVSKEWNPVHTYNISRKKKYVITLRVKNGECDDQIEQEISF